MMCASATYEKMTATTRADENRVRGAARPHLGSVVAAHRRYGGRRTRAARRAITARRSQTETTVPPAIAAGINIRPRTNKAKIVSRETFLQGFGYDPGSRSRRALHSGAPAISIEHVSMAAPANPAAPPEAHLRAVRQQMAEKKGETSTVKRQKKRDCVSGGQPVPPEAHLRAARQQMAEKKGETSTVKRQKRDCVSGGQPVPPEAHLRAARQQMAGIVREILNQIGDELERWSKHLSE